MMLVRRRVLQMAGTLVTVSAVVRPICAQPAGAGPTANQILRRNLEGQGEKVQETVVTIVEFSPGSLAHWHMHPGAQEFLYGLEGDLAVEVEGKGVTGIKVGDVGLIPGDVPHTVRNESSGRARVLVVHSRSDRANPLRVDLNK